jgi:hypothetical protein
MVAGARIVGGALTNALKHAGMVETAQQSETIVFYRPSGSRAASAVSGSIISPSTMKKIACNLGGDLAFRFSTRR